MTVPGFRTYWAAATIGAFGSSVTVIAIQVLVVSVLDASATEVGLIRAVQLLPYLLLGLVVGALVDRMRRKPVLVWSNVLLAATLLVIPALWALDRLSLWAVAVVLFLFGTLNVIEFAALQSFLPRLVPRSELLAANARLDQSETVAQTTGPVVGGGLVSLLGAPWAVLVDAVSYLVSAVLIARVPIDEPPPRPTTTRLRQEIIEGVRWIYLHKTLAPLAWSTHVWFLGNSMAATVLVPFALRSLGLSPLTYGIALALAGVGGLLGALLATRLGHSYGAGRIVLLGRLLTMAAWAVVALAPAASAGVTLSSSFFAIAAGQLTLGLGMGVENANEMGYWQANTPDEVQGRVNATRRSANRTIAVAGAVVGGLLADLVGFRPTLWLAVAVFAVASAILALSPFRSARH
ncbi:MFS transporter [Nocardioides sp. NBC_00163]|uniref:MFS transporter n=1 Tax=Nocardioides sp. NBC_00163 TaxID=2975999 RepID=UPI00324DE85A